MKNAVLDPNATQPQDTPSEDTPYFDDAAARFNAAVGNEPEPKKEEPKAKPQAKKEETAKETKEEPAKSGIPEEFLTGKKPEAKETKESPTEETLEEPPAGLSAKASERFTTLAKKASTATAERDALKKELETLKASQSKPDETTAAELKAAREQLAEYEALIERTAFERSPRFQALTKREAASLDAAKEYLKGGEVNPDVIDSAARATGARRLAILKEAGLDAEMIAVVSPYLAQYDSVQADKSSALENSKLTAQQWEAQEKQRKEHADARVRQEEDAVFTRVTGDVSKVFEPLMKVDGHPEWNAQADKLQEEAKAFFNGDLPLEKIAEIAAYGVGAKVIHGMFHSLRDENKNLRQKIADLESASPNAGNRQTSDGKPVADDPKVEYIVGATKRFEALVGH